MKQKKTILSFSILLVLITVISCTQTEKKQTENETKFSANEIKSLMLVKDEMEIRALADKFSDAANRIDSAAFQALWAKDGIWKIGPPINMEFKGKENMANSVSKMLGLWDFFVQMNGPGVIMINGDKATSRFYVNEIARKADDKTGNYNLSMYEDELIKENGKWFFLKRNYHTIYQDAPVYKGLIQKLSK
jgi:SnoaL-like domain